MDNFIQIEIYTTSQAIDGITGALTDYGITGFIISDSADFEDFLADKDANWDYVDDELMGLKNRRAAYHSVCSRQRAGRGDGGGYKVPH